MNSSTDAPAISAAPPVTIIRPARGWVAIDFRELWHYRELFGFLIWRDILIKYKQTFFGFAWAILVPVIQMVIFGTIFGQVAGLPTDGLPQYLYYFTNLTLWTFFATAFNRTSVSLVNSANLLTKIYFPRLLVPASNCIGGVVDFAIAIVVLLAMGLFLGKIPAATLVFVPLLVLLAGTAALGTGLFFAALNVRFRDVGILIPFLTQIWMYCTVIVPYSRIAPKLGGWAWLYGLNPVAGAVEMFRWCLYHPYLTSPAPWSLLWAGIPVACLMLLAGLYYFRRTEKIFADIV